MTAPTNWPLGALAVCVFLGLLGTMDEQPTEAQDVADEVKVAPQRSGLDAEINVLALKICIAELGPGTRVVWTVDGDLVCRPVDQTAQGGQP